MPDSMVESLWQRFETFTQQAVERVLKTGGTVHCRAGCGNCCRLAVMTTAAEARYLAAVVDGPIRSRLDTYIDRLRTLLPGIQSRADLVRRHPTELGPCPFLGPHETCEVHGQRPLACRALLATRSHHWCAVDLSTLPKIERRLFIDSLNADLVALPTHYLQSPLDKAREFEQQLLSLSGMNLYGHLPTLVWLELNFGLSLPAGGDPEVLADRFGTTGLYHPALLTTAG